MTLRNLFKFRFMPVLFALLFGFLLFSNTSCKTKEGCGLEEKYNNVDLESSKRGKSDLFSKKQKKKMKKS